MTSGNEKTFGAFCIAAAGSGEGKTTISLALMRAISRRGLIVQPFKCGPDYIDTQFHDSASGRRSRNLDSWMMGTDGVAKSFAEASLDADFAVIEGVMGMFDSAAPGSLEGSTAQTALITGCPVILVVNAKGMAGSIAAMVKGYSEFCPQIRVAGVIANNTGSDGHAEILRKALEIANLPPMLGYFPRNDSWKMPERHLGLVPCSENTLDDSYFEMLADAAEKYCDIDRIMNLSRMPRPNAVVKKNTAVRARIALALDGAFHFYYEDNLDILRQAGAELVRFSPLHDRALPENISGLYIGGGFPEMFAAELEANISMKESIAAFQHEGGLIYAECGGFMYLSESITDNSGKKHKMCGLVPGHTTMTGRLRSLGYRKAQTVGDSFFGPAGTLFRGHEFHWSDIEYSDAVMPMWNISNSDGTKTSASGCQDSNLCASYIHLHFASNPKAVECMVGRCAAISSEK